MSTARTAAEAFALAGLQVFERGWLSSNNVLFAGSEHEASVLVDTGYWSHAEQTLALVRGALGGRQLDRVVNTHLHSDHCGGNAALVEAFACDILVPAGEQAKVVAWDEAKLTYRDTGQHCPRFTTHLGLNAGDTLRLGALEWRVLAAPGHDPESVVLYQPDLRLLVSADALWANGFGVVFPEIEGEHAFDDVRWTLDQLSGLAVDWVIPGHGAPFGDVEEALVRARSRLSSFVADPRKHALHAAKVLLKFHLLEVHRKPLDALLAWFDGVRYLQLLHRAHFAGIERHTWASDIVEGMCRSGALKLEGMTISNV